MNEQINFFCEDFRQNTMMINLSECDKELIIQGGKTVIVLRKIPRLQIIDLSKSQGIHPKVYLYTENIGVWGECFCQLSFNNTDYETKSSSYFYYTTKDRYYNKLYKRNPQEYKNMLDEMNKSIDLSGTCMSFEEFIDYAGIAGYIFFKIINLKIYDNFLPIDNFRLSVYQFRQKITKPNGWCYAIKKDSQK